jgi:glycosyltransferase involved in cell wall biosynthesis
MSTSDIDYSIVIPVYYNEGSLKRTFELIKSKVMDQHQELNGEVIFVDDGSGDDSLKELLELRTQYPACVKVIKFTRNFGQPNAVMAGMNLATGRCTVSMSADLQDPPELISDMLQYHLNEGFEIVICSRESRDESTVRRVTSQFFYKLMKKLSFPDMPDKGFDYVLLGERPKALILESNESNAFLQGQVLWTGFPIKYIPYRRLRREVGESQWSLGKKVKYLIDGVLGYSYLPIRAMSVIGGITALSGFIYALLIFVAYFFTDNAVKGWSPLMMAFLILSGIQMLMLGIIGEYLWRTLDQVKGRKPYIVDKVYQ